MRRPNPFPPRHGAFRTRGISLSRTASTPGARALFAVALVGLAAVGAPAGAAGAAEVGLSLLDTVGLTLANDPNIALAESALDADRGTLLAAEGRFDPLLTADLTGSEDEAPIDADTSSRSSTSTAQVGVERRLRGGQTLTPEISLSRVDSVGAVNRATVSFSFRQPLLRGRGREVTTSDVESATRDVEAGRRDLRHTLARRLLAVGNQYWAVKAALENLEILRATETGSLALLENTRRLIAADLTPAAELVQLEADLASKQANRISGEQALYAARQALARDIGLDAWQHQLPLPSDAFPTVDPAHLPPPDAGPGLARRAFEQRDDLRAATLRLRADELRLRADEDAVLPRLDLVVTPSYSSLEEGTALGDFFTPLYDRIPGLSASFGLSFSLLTGNRAARGNRIRSQSVVRRGGLQVDLLRKTIGADVLIALDALRAGAERLERVAAAERFFARAVENEEKKLRGGTSTLIDVISQRDRLTSAQQGRVNAQRALALAILELRFQTGTLIGPDGESADPKSATEGTTEGGRGAAIGVDNLTTLPPATFAP